jgi:hypothetical protein
MKNIHHSQMDVGATCNCPAAQALRTIAAYAVPTAIVEEELNGHNCKAKLGIDTRIFNRHVKAVPGAHKVGKVWYCAKGAWTSYHAAKTATAHDESDAYAVAVAKAGRR